MEKVICIVGPTAVGKTKLSIELAKKLGGEIISADSVQVYRKLNIGSAKVTEAEMDGIPHHLIDIKDASESYDMQEFQKESRRLIKNITSRGKTPIVVGGTGLYIKGMLYDYELIAPERDVDFKFKYETLDNVMLHELLLKYDPATARILHPNNRRRVERAIEIFETTGKTKSELEAAQTKMPIFNATIIGLKTNRDNLYARINDRVDKMIEDGLVDEVKAIIADGVNESCQSLRSIGYKEVMPYINKEETLANVVDAIKQNSRNFAKRQLTWFNNQMKVQWFETNYDNFALTIKEVKEELKNHV